MLCRLPAHPRARWNGAPGKVRPPRQAMVRKAVPGGLDPQSPFQVDPRGHGHRQCPDAPQPQHHQSVLEAVDL